MHEINLKTNVLEKNEAFAKENREIFAQEKNFVINITGSPGSGKTSLLEKTIEKLKAKNKIAVIEGDMKTRLDADRIEKLGVKAFQINTGKDCHLDAHMVHHALHDFNLKGLDILFVENVGNLVCPAEFDLGENCMALVYSVAEGHDKPEKYPFMFSKADIILINKTDLAPYIEFNMGYALKAIKTLNPTAKIIKVSCKTGDGLNEWLNWLKEQNKERVTSDE